MPRFLVFAKLHMEATAAPLSLIDMAGKSMHPRPIDDLSDVEILELPLDALAFRLLADLAADDTHRDTHHVGNELNSWRAAGVNPNGAVMRSLVEAYSWLDRSGLIANNGQGSPYNGFVTRLGRRVVEDGLGLLGAIESLSADLHPDVAAVRSQFLLGEYELAAFAAMRAVEVRVREVAGYAHADIGVKMMRNAFHAETGPLTDEDAEGGERQGVSDLFAGAFAVFKNPTSHRIVSFENPSEAAEVVSLASLLLRILDRREAARAGG